MREPHVHAVLAGERVRAEECVWEGQRLAGQQQAGNRRRGHAHLRSALAVENLKRQTELDQKEPNDCDREPAGPPRWAVSLRPSTWLTWGWRFFLCTSEHFLSSRQSPSLHPTKLPLKKRELEISYRGTLSRRVPKNTQPHVHLTKPRRAHTHTHRPTQISTHLLLDVDYFWFRRGHKGEWTQRYCVQSAHSVREKKGIHVIHI